MQHYAHYLTYADLEKCEFHELRHCLDISHLASFLGLCTFQFKTP